MKKITLTFITIFTMSLYGQDSLPDNYPKNELKVNALYTLLGLPEITYERSINRFSSFGASIFYGVARNTNVGIGLFPFYRWYFGQKKPVCGFFLEGNAGIYSQDALYITYDPSGNYYSKTKEEIQGGLGIALGGKFEVHKVWTAEILGGLGRNFIQSENLHNNEVYPRFGISIGRRF
jgi:hypothetical protein